MTQEKRGELMNTLKARIKMYSHINRNCEEIATLTAGDEFERLQLASDRDVLLHHVSQESAMLREMNDALQRLEDGTYGYCVACKEEIPPKRLSAIPWVAYCVHCQEQIENAHSDDGDVFRELAA
jgi:DnaK suppressor protein